MISNVKIYGIEESMLASGYPMLTKLQNEIGSQDYNRSLTLSECNIGEGHDNFLNGIIIQFDLKASLKMWTQLQRYHFMDFVSSQSTMHRITKFDIETQCNEWVDKEIIKRFKVLVDTYNSNPISENFNRVIYNIPSGFELTARMTTNYRQLKTIYKQRRNHRLPEWRSFCKWVETLPYFEFICKDGE